MPWWIWLVLALFMLTMITVGLVYAGIHGAHSLKDMAHTGERVGERISAMAENELSDQGHEAPIFVQPLSVAQERYSDAYAQVLRRKADKRNRHIQAWNRWKRFNN
ncbi:hypothetical protein [Bifidobacterium scaligerum]|uniref:Uncharacterized protein n=1 Tax=Bifidobacterium scaligerum TaxID=2052656 RepID=A0A2M9HT26_9BIFI|nr:hypothetical protein [Bifidobacterium scaligerum]PJM79960.1 hypothetical protein CUU80_02160 [Bifidobacterium scaligerum]